MLTHPNELQPYAARLFSRIQEASDHTRLLRDWGLRYEQLSRGKFEGSLQEAWLDGIHLYRETLSQVVFQTGKSCQNSVSIGIFTSLSGDARWFGESLTVDDIMYLRPGDELVLTTPQQSTLLVMTIPRHMLAIESLDTPRRFVRNPVLATHFRDCVEHALNLLLSKPLSFAKESARLQFREEMKEFVYQYFFRSQSAREAITRNRAQEIVHRVIHIIDEQGDTPPSIDDICKHSYVSRRALQNCFERITGASPGAFMKAQRLNSVRRELLNLCPNEHARIGDVAARWGFWHLSQFANDYKRLFAESPSDTVRFSMYRNR